MLCGEYLAKCRSVPSAPREVFVCSSRRKWFVPTTQNVRHARCSWLFHAEWCANVVLKRLFVPQAPHLLKSCSACGGGGVLVHHASTARADACADGNASSMAATQDLFSRNAQQQVPWSRRGGGGAEPSRPVAGRYLLARHLGSAALVAPPPRLFHVCVQKTA